MNIPWRTESFGPLFRTRHFRTLLLLFLLIQAGGCSDTGTEPPTEQPTTVELLQQALEQQVNGLVGISAAIQFSDTLLWTGTAGFSDPLGGVTMNANMPLGIGSITKTYVAAVVLDLVDEGLLDLDNPISDWLAPVENIDGTSTVRQLLGHTSGTADYVDDPALFTDIFAEPDRLWTTEDIFSRVAPPNFAPGEGWAYSNTGYVLLGELIEAATGSTVIENVRTRLLEPLRLTNTEMDPAAAIPSMAHGWHDLDGDGTADDLSGLPRVSLYSAAGAAGGIVAPPSEVARWTSALPGGDVLDDANLVKMTTASAPSNGYGLGAERFTIRGSALWGHGGGIPGFASLTVYSPEHDASLALVVNQTNADPLQIMGALFQVLLDGLEE